MLSLPDLSAHLGVAKGQDCRLFAMLLLLRAFSGAYVTSLRDDEFKSALPGLWFFCTASRV